MWLTRRSGDAKTEWCAGFLVGRSTIVWKIVFCSVDLRVYLTRRSQRRAFSNTFAFSLFECADAMGSGAAEKG